MPKRGDPGGKLGEYDSKRHFETTPEPPGQMTSSETGRLYVIHKHQATRLHYDLRLEHEGVLLSWAVPKGPSLDTKQRRLAVRVEDHPVEYGEFEGVIPTGDYGGGTVMIWDRGTWSPQGDVTEALAEGKLVFELSGERLGGRFGLIHTGARKKGRERNQWLLIKEKDSFVRHADEFDVAEALTDSAATGRTMEEIAESGSAESHHQEEEEEELVGFPNDLNPQLPTLVDKVPSGDEWIHEIKHDGYRLLLLVGRGVARALTREGHDWSDRFADLLRAASTLPVDSAVLDVEAIVPSERRASDFGALQRALAEGRGEAISAFCFDLLFLNGDDLRELPLVERKRVLERLLAEAPAEGRIVYSDHISGNAESLLARACELGAEGLVSKRSDSVYRGGRGRDWLKTKCIERQEFLVLGYTAGKGRRTGLGSLLLGTRDEDGHLVYAGRVGSGLSEHTLNELATELAGIERGDPPVAGVDVRGEATWVDPQVVVEVAFGGWTSRGRVRHASFVGRRRDRDPSGVGRDAASALVEGVAITHPSRVMIEGGPTKLDLAKYYAEVATHVLRHAAGRPLTLLRCPNGESGSCFWQRHIEEGVLTHVHAGAARGWEFVHISDAAGLVELVQYLAVELHVWGSRVEHPDLPDRLVFDLDPGPGCDWDDVRAAALLAREVLAGHHLVSFVKTSGGKGLHVVVPIVPRVPVREASRATKAISTEIVAASGGRLTIDPRKRSRVNRIFLDWHRNGAAQSTVSAYVARARVGAPISTPLTWEEIREDLDPASLTPARVLARLSASGDPWMDLATVEQYLPQEALDVQDDYPDRG